MSLTLFQLGATLNTAGDGGNEGDGEDLDNAIFLSIFFLFTPRSSP
ncbi:hypothetical protein [Crinalium epipsammum]|nr:hypothetical protein [Crinalium epipsammum]